MPGYRRPKRARSAVALLALSACLLIPTISQAALPDNRGWELVSPVDKNGGEVAAPGTLAGGGVLQAAQAGGAISYGSATSFAGGQGAPEGSQYLGSRSSSGWSTANLTTPLFSGSYGAEPEGVPFQLFSADLSRAILLSGRHCRSTEETDCPVANQPLAGTEAPAGYENYYLREGSSFAATANHAAVANTDVPPAQFDLDFAGASPDLSHIVLSSCAALTPDATEAPLGEGCDPAQPNLYEWSQASGLDLINSAPGAELGAQAGAISEDGSRVYWRDLTGGNLQLSEGATTKQVDTAAGGGGAFETASVDGSIAYFSKGGHLYRYGAVANSATDLTPSGGVLGVLGASADGTHVYYLTTEGLFLRDGETTTKVASAPEPLTEAAADPSNYPPVIGTARVSPDGTHLLFLSKTSLTGYDNTDQKTGLPDTEVFLYDAGTLRCLSCRPNGTRPIGSSTIPGASANGEGSGATQAYKPRALSADGKRVFFDSTDAVFGPDTNKDRDVYEWQAQGVGGCAKAAGCVALLSTGHGENGASFMDASADGTDAFFITDESLVGIDPGSVDLYDARIGGGFPEPLVPIPCFGDNCQNLPSEPVDPGLSTLQSGPGNPKAHYRKYRRKPESKCGGKKCKGKGGKGKKHGKGGKRSATTKSRGRGAR